MLRRKEFAQMTPIREVLVKRKRDGCRFVCRPTQLGWKCGFCLHGNLGPLPKPRRRCRVCKASVSEVVLEGQCGPRFEWTTWE